MYVLPTLDCPNAVSFLYCEESKNGVLLYTYVAVSYNVTNRKPTINPNLPNPMGVMRKVQKWEDARGNERRVIEPATYRVLHATEVVWTSKHFRSYK